VHIPTTRAYDPTGGGVTKLWQATVMPLSGLPSERTKELVEQESTRPQTVVNSPNVLESAQLAFDMPSGLIVDVAPVALTDAFSSTRIPASVDIRPTMDTSLPGAIL